MKTKPCWITDSLPDSEITVLLRLGGQDEPIWIGFHDGANWLTAQADRVEVPVLGWMHLHDAAAALDFGSTNFSRSTGQGAARDGRNSGGRHGPGSCPAVSTTRERLESSRQ